MRPETALGVDLGVRRLLTWVIISSDDVPISDGVIPAPSTLDRMAAYLDGSAELTRRDLSQVRVDLDMAYAKAARQILEIASLHKSFIVADVFHGVDEETHGFEKLGSYAGPAKFPQGRLAVWTKLPLEFFASCLGRGAKARGLPSPLCRPLGVTSQLCPVCFNKGKGQRSANFFRCYKCGFEADADKTSAWLIAEEGLAYIEQRWRVLEALSDLAEGKKKALEPSAPGLSGSR